MMNHIGGMPSWRFWLPLGTLMGPGLRIWWLLGDIKERVPDREKSS